MWKKITNIGVDDQLPAHLAAKVRLTNQILAFLIGSCIPLVFSALGSVLSLFAGTAVLVALSMYWLNHLGWHRASRMLIVVIGTLLATIPALYATPAGLLPPTSTFTLSLGLCAIVFVLFDHREVRYIYIVLVFNICWTLSVPFLAPYFPKTIDYQDFIAPNKQMIRIVFSFFFMTGSLLLLHRAMGKTEKANAASVDDLAQKQAEMAAQRQALEQTLAELKMAQTGDERRNWVNEQLGRWTELLRQGRDLGQLYPQLLSFVVKTLGANQGGLYVVEPGDTGGAELDLKASYAWDRQKFHRQRVSAKAGLLGQAYLEKESLLLTQIPADYIQIVSSLGAASPTVLLIEPLIYKDQVEGVIELAAFRVLDTHERELIRKIGQALAAALADYRTTAQSTRLLAETEHQRERLRIQEEEMRQQLEEMRATIDAAEHKEQGYLHRLAELEGQLAKQ
jgi:chaperonin cofactor prefoldin